MFRDHYIGRCVQVKMPLPDTKSPLMLYPQRAHKIDAPLLALKLEKPGMSLAPGDVCAIKSVDVSSKELTFELVGIDAIAVRDRMDPELLDEDVWGLGGSRIRIVLDKPLDRPQGAIGQVNSWLGEVITTRSLVSDEDLPPETREAIRNGIALAGMNHKAVFLVLGDPTETLRELRPDGLDEAWIYEREDFSTLMVYFRNGTVVFLREF